MCIMPMAESILCTKFLRNNCPFECWLIKQPKRQYCKSCRSTYCMPVVFHACMRIFSTPSLEKICTTAQKNSIILLVMLIRLQGFRRQPQKKYAILTFFWRFVDKPFKACFHNFHGLLCPYRGRLRQGSGRRPQGKLLIPASQKGSAVQAPSGRRQVLAPYFCRNFRGWLSACWARAGTPRHAKVECVTCHHQVDGKESFAKCGSSGCHDDLTGKQGEKSLYYVVHTKKELKHNNCIGCHSKVVEGKPDLKKDLTACAKSKCHP